MAELSATVWRERIKMAKMKESRTAAEAFDERTSARESQGIFETLDRESVNKEEGSRRRRLRDREEERASERAPRTVMEADLPSGRRVSTCCTRHYLPPCQCASTAAAGQCLRSRGLRWIAEPELRAVARGERYQKLGTTRRSDCGLHLARLWTASSIFADIRAASCFCGGGAARRKEAKRRERPQESDTSRYDRSVKSRTVAARNPSGQRTPARDGGCVLLALVTSRNSSSLLE